MLKRGFDIVIASLALIVCVPVLLICACAVRLDSSGPILFRQHRVGRFSKPFRILKFRTMTSEFAGDTPQITVNDDDRVTRTGRWLRRTKLDELPQLLNVLRGDMSLVGPRPEVPAYVDLYPSGVRDLILSVRPGITDTASIQFRDEGALLAKATHPDRMYRDEILPKKLALYEQYVRSHDMAGDLVILWKTVRALVGRR